eukprot:scaffold53218_cov31-Attheya_sp.AAC.1
MQIEFPAMVPVAYGSMRAYFFSHQKWPASSRLNRSQAWSERVSEPLPHYKTPTVNTSGRRCCCDASIVWLHNRMMAVCISRADVSSHLCVLDLVTLAVVS